MHLTDAFIQFVLGNLKEMHKQMKCTAFQSDFVTLVWFVLIIMLALALLRKKGKEIKEKCSFMLSVLTVYIHIQICRWL